MRTNLSKILNLAILIGIVLLIIPQTRLPIQVFINKIVASVISPSEIDKGQQHILTDYDWKLQSITGESFDFRNAEGRVVVLNFWATWCPPCIAEMPSIQALYDKYQDNDDVVFLLVSNEDVSTIKNFMAKKDYSFKVYQAVTDYPKDFEISSIPRTFVINREGHVVIDKSGAANWNSDAVVKCIDKALKVF